MRLTAAETVAALARLGFPALSTATLRDWRRRGHLTAGRGYDPDEVIAVYMRRAERTQAA